MTTVQTPQLILLALKSESESTDPQPAPQSALQDIPEVMSVEEVFLGEFWGCQAVEQGNDKDPWPSSEVGTALPHETVLCCFSASCKMPQDSSTWVYFILASQDSP